MSDVLSPFLKASWEGVNVLVFGDGPSALISACLFAKGGARVLRISTQGDEKPVFSQSRTVALMRPAIQVLRELGIEPSSFLKTAPLWGLKLLDGIKGTEKSVFFSAKEEGSGSCDTPFGWNIPLGDLIAVLSARAEALGVFTLRAVSFAYRVRAGRAMLSVSLPSGEEVCLGADFVVGADGRFSRIRTMAGIGSHDTPFAQSALTLVFSHSKPHGGTSFEWYGSGGPCTTVPLDGPHRSSLVWMDHPDRLEEVKAAREGERRRLLQLRVGGELGQVSSLSSLAIWGPLCQTRVETFAQNRVFLVGDCAHTVLPIGAQGLNMGVADAWVLAQLFEEYVQKGKRVGGFEMMAAYNDARRLDVALRQRAGEGLNRSLLSAFVGPHMARRMGLSLLERSGFLRSFFVDLALGNPSSYKTSS